MRATRRMRKRLQVETVSTAGLNLHPDNVRVHNRKNIEAIMTSLQKFGQQKPIVVGAGDKVIAGNGTLEAANRMGWGTIDIVRTELQDSDELAFMIADNKTTDMSEFDPESLAQIIDGLDSQGYDLTTTGFREYELNTLLDSVREPDGRDADAVPGLPEKAVSITGEIYLLGKHRLMCGDATEQINVERLMNGKKADMVFADPPYGVGYMGGRATPKKREKLRGDSQDAAWLYEAALRAAMPMIDDKAAFYIWFALGSVQTIYIALNNAGMQVRAVLIWHKINAGFGSLGVHYKMKYEPCAYGSKVGYTERWYGPTNEVTVWDIPRDGRSTYHPTQKPVALPLRAISNSTELGQCVLDLFLGSGTTIIACEKLGRIGYGMEIEPGYCDVIRKRWAEFVHGEDCDWGKLTAPQVSRKRCTVRHINARRRGN